MYTAIQHLHSYWAYIVVIIVFIAMVNALYGVASKRPYGPKDYRISLFALIVAHLQLLIGIVLFFVSDKVRWFDGDTPVSIIMKNSDLRLYNMEHPLLMIIAIILITIGYSKHKKKLASAKKFKTLAIFYTLAMIAILAMIPWAAWWGM